MELVPHVVGAIYRCAADPEPAAGVLVGYDRPHRPVLLRAAQA